MWDHNSYFNLDRTGEVLEVQTPPTSDPLLILCLTNYDPKLYTSPTVP